MAKERFRIFKGSTELNYSNASISRTNDHIVDSGSVSFEANSNVTNNSVIDFKKADGVTNVFTAKIIELKQKDFWTSKVLTNGYELHNIRVETVYENMSPEAIVQDIVDNRTENLTYASTATSGITISKYVAKEYAIDIIKIMLNVLQWQMRIDENDNVYFEPEGNIDNGRTFTNGTNINITDWLDDKYSQFNKVKIIGGFESYATEETISGTGTVFNLTNKPSGSVRVTIGGVEESPNLFSVDSEKKQITFDSTKTNPHFSYSYTQPVVVQDQDDDSITDYGEIFREIQAPWLDNFSDARRYAQNLLDVFSIPLVSAKGKQPELNFDVDIGELCIVQDPVRDITKTLVVRKIIYDASSNSTSYEFGTRDLIFFDWQRETQDRVKDLERRFINEETVTTFARLFKHNLNITLTQTNNIKINFLGDSFILGHNTLGRFRTNINFEADCSDNLNNGVWTGSGIDGDQYNLAGWLLSEGQFNGTDRIITVTDTADLRFTGDFSIALSVKVNTLPGAETYILNKWDGTDGYAIRINSSNKVELIYSDSGSDSTITADTALTAGGYQHLVFTKSGTDLIVYVNGSSNNTETGGATVGSNTEDLVIGKYTSSFFNGSLDEIRFYSDNLSAANVTNLFNKIDVSTNEVCYMSMDNPRLGDRITPKVIHNSETSFELDLGETDWANDFTANIDTTNERIALASDTNKQTVRNTFVETKQIFFGGNNFNALNIRADETLWGNDVVKYFLSADRNTWDEYTNGVTATPSVLGNDIGVKVVLIGNGASDTYIENPIINFTRAT